MPSNENFNSDKVLWDLLLHLEEIITNRTNFFLVAESIFILAYPDLQSPQRAMHFLFISGGILLSLIWLLLQSKTYGNMGDLTEQIKGKFPEYDIWANKRKGKMIKSNQIITYWLPIFFILFWIFLFLSDC